MKEEDDVQDIPEYLQNLRNFIVETILESEDPVSKRTAISLHDNDIGVADNSIIVHRSHPLVKPKVFKTTDLCKDIMQHTALVNALGKTHLLDGYLSGLLYVRLAPVNDSVSPCTDLLPIFIVAEICKGSGQEF